MSESRTLILGASMGLGQEFSKLCRKNRWPTIEVSLEKEAPTTNDRHVYQCDFADPKAVNKLLATLDGENYVISRFFWVAGTLWRGYFADQPQADLQHIIDVNVRNSIAIALWAWKKMSGNTIPSSYTVVSSASGVRIYNDFLKYTRQVSYVTTKYAQVGFTRALAAENQNQNIKFSLILPDGMNTPMRRHFKPEENQNLLDPEQVAAYFMEKIMNQTEPYFEDFIPKGFFDTHPMPAEPAQAKRQSA